MTLKGTTRDGCTPDARVVVDGTEIPYCNDGVETHVRKDGPADITRESTIQIPIVWGDDVVAEAINGLSGQTPQRQQCTVEFIDPFEDDYVPIHHGYISAAGGHPDQGAARFQVADFAQLLGEIPASVTFEKDASLGTVLKYVRETFLDGQEVTDDLEVVGWDDDQQVLTTAEEFDNTITGLGRDGIEGILVGFLFDSFVDDTVSFGADRDTLADVVDWVTARGDRRWYFMPQPDGHPPRLVLERNPTTAAFHDRDHVAPQLGHSREIKLLENNALYQLNPPHKLKVRGRTASTLGDLTNRELPNDEFPVVTAVYEPLEAQSADDYPPNEIEVDTTTPEKTEIIARRELKDRLDAAAGGEMILPPTPFLRPYARVDAIPVCGSAALADLPPIAYEAEEIVHYATTAAEGTDPPSPRTVVRCGLYVEEERIETTTETENA